MLCFTSRHDVRRELILISYIRFASQFCKTAAQLLIGSLIWSFPSLEGSEVKGRPLTITGYSRSGVYKGSPVDGPYP